MALFPIEDVRLIKNLHLFAMIDKTTAEQVLDKVPRHTWYVSGELAGFALFSNQLEISLKIDMLRALEYTESCWNSRSMKVDKDIKKKIDKYGRSGLKYDDVCIELLRNKYA